MVPAAEQPERRQVHAPPVGNDVEAGGVAERVCDLGLGREGLVASVPARQLLVAVLLVECDDPRGGEDDERHAL
jgi:hypothetical protein